MHIVLIKRNKRWDPSMCRVRVIIDKTRSYNIPSTIQSVNRKMIFLHHWWNDLRLNGSQKSKPGSKHVKKKKIMIVDDMQNL